jgi:phosphatidylglycerophosphate synthase
MLILSVLMPIFIFSYPLNIALLSIILILDFLDGAAARQQKSEQRQGYLIDTTSDKISDFLCVIGLIALPIGKVFLILVIINIFLQFYALKTNKHHILAIRFFLLVYLIARYSVIN